MPEDEKCTTCKGEGWLTGDGPVTTMNGSRVETDGQACPDCLNPEWLGGTGLKEGKLPNA